MTTHSELRAFVSYASDDDAERVRLDRHLAVLKRSGRLESWFDRKILPGERWADRIDHELDRADFVLALVSADFIASEYCQYELARALAAGKRVVPVLVKPCAWQHSSLKDLQMLPDRATPISSMRDPEAGWAIVADAVSRLLTELAESPAGQGRLSGDGGDSSGNAPDGGQSGSGEPDPTRYLEAVRAEHAYVELRGMGAQVAEQLPLDDVYIRLRAADPRPAAGAERAEPGKSEVPGVGGQSSSRRREKAAGADRVDAEAGGPRSLADVLADHPSVALIGDPGSGKTTFLRYVAQQLAKAHLGDAEAASRVGCSPASPPFPVFVRVERLAAYLDDDPSRDHEPDAPAQLFRYLQHRLNGGRYGLPVDYLTRHVCDRKACLLLDGLDEVPGAERREIMSRLLDNLVREYPGNRFVLTCRTRAWQGRTQSGALSVHRLAPLGPEQVDQFCGNWARALYKITSDAGRPDAGRPTSDTTAAGVAATGSTEAGTTAGAGADEARRAQAEAYAASLREAIEANPSGHTFTENPLMLTVLAVVHWNERKLPEQRAELYDRSVEYLLESRRDIAEHETPLRRECLQAVAMAMFEHAEGVQRSLGLDEAATAVADVLGCDAASAARTLEHETLLSGLLVSRSEGEVEFWHLVFQEYLAALELSQADDWWPRIAPPRLFDDRWSEVVCLLGGCLRSKAGQRGPRRYLDKVLGTGSDPVSNARAVALAARIRRDLLPYGGEPADRTPFFEMLEATIGLFEPGGETAEESVRVEVGEALGEVGDPRLVDPGANRLHIPGGTFRMGAQKKDPSAPGFDRNSYDDESPVHEVTVSAKVVARFPVTVAEYAAFLAAGDRGYLSPRCWEPSGWAWRTRQSVESPDKWESQQKHGNRPVTGVSWYEADAYARWVGGRLPTEAEWEWLARGAEDRRYPWGDDAPTAAHANYDVRIGRPTPVGIYPLGKSPDRISDLAGNVWEWCADWFGPYGGEKRLDPEGPSQGDGRVLRGGSWLVDAAYLRAASRIYDHPEFRFDFVGFRVVWLPPEDNN